MDTQNQNPWAMTAMDLDGVKARVEKKLEFGGDKAKALAEVKRELDLSEKDMQALDLYMAPLPPRTGPRWGLKGKPGGVIEDRRIKLDAARENGYAIATYTYSKAKIEKEWDYDLSALFDGFSPGYTCEVWDLVAGEKIIEKDGDGPHAARTAAMASYATNLLGDTLSHEMHRSVIDGIYTLSLGQAAASGRPISGDLPPIMKGDDIKDWLKRKKLSQAQAAELCMVSQRTFRRWIAGRPPMPMAAWELLREKAERMNHSQGPAPSVGHMEDKMEKGLIFKEIKTGNLFEAYTIDHKSERVGGYKIFAAFGESNPFRIFGFNDVKFHNVPEPPTEQSLA